ncbi:MAG: nucleotidyltransferase [Bacteroidales bacterium]|nr:MAG: nucleotidyltransferase [Bacteroidales bacterium]
MARAIKAIKEEITGAIIGQPVLINALGLDISKTFDEQVSKTNIVGLLTYVVAVAIFSLEKLFDQFKKDVDVKIKEMKPHSLRWYNNKAQAFQYGHSLLAESDLYSEVDEAAQLVKFSAVQEIEGKLTVKVAKDNGEGNPTSLVGDEFVSFTNYCARVKDAGVVLIVKSAPGDQLRLSLDLYYDPLVLDGEGQRLDGSGNTPVQDAIREFIKILPFNGEFVIAHLVDALQETEGVTIPNVLSCETKYGGYDFSQVNAQSVPDAGYLELKDEDLTVNWIADV